MTITKQYYNTLVWAKLSNPANNYLEVIQVQTPFKIYALLFLKPKHVEYKCNGLLIKLKTPIFPDYILGS